MSSRVGGGSKSVRCMTYSYELNNLTKATYVRVCVRVCVCVYICVYEFVHAYRQKLNGKAITRKLLHTSRLFIQSIYDRLHQEIHFAKQAYSSCI